MAEAHSRRHAFGDRVDLAAFDHNPRSWHNRLVPTARSSTSTVDRAGQRPFALGMIFHLLSKGAIWGRRAKLSAVATREPVGTL